MKLLAHLILISLAWTGSAQVHLNSIEQLTLRVSYAQDSSERALVKYTFKRETEYAIGGKIMLRSVNQSSYKNDQWQVKILKLERKYDMRTASYYKKMNRMDSLLYFQVASGLLSRYMDMGRGQLLDFFTKASIAEQAGILEIVASSLFVPGDHPIAHVDSQTFLFLDKEFISFVGKDKVRGMITYEKIKTGVNLATHATLTNRSNNSEISVDISDLVLSNR